MTRFRVMRSRVMIAGTSTVRSGVMGDTTECISTPPLNRYFHEMEMLVEVKSRVKLLMT